ncbi:tryptophan dimethylallyltransferase-domain-containing protein [Crucibulum laeve]|uniref:Tryptophan dimethylallyltransferase-domain-containing protein n=1 Tax=Crucibulum laeve TaxID=68775 RepID=A0A5C3LNS0_9AGAR|nr:tryptophan dimethylallyltransferase-domain-containing protein [Crucibulum laeve]
MDNLFEDRCFFPRGPSSRVYPETGPNYEASRSHIQAIASSLLGRDVSLSTENLGSTSALSPLPIYNALSSLLPFNSYQTEFFWKKLAKPFASMIDTAGFTPAIQCRFLTFVYARVLGMMGPSNENGSNSYMTIDGSPAELSWVIPRRKVAKGALTRQVRFAIEPIDPRSGRPLRGSTVLDYLTTTRGSLGGVVTCDKGGMSWRKSTERFLFPEDDGSEVPEGSRFFVGFDFSQEGNVTLKAYYIPAPSPYSSSFLSASKSCPMPSPISLWDTDYTAVRKLVSRIDRGLLKPFDNLLSYFDTLDESHKPRIQILSVDCVRNGQNRLKIYCRPKTGNSWSDAKRSFTLGGRIEGPVVEHALGRLETLWNNLFPFANSSIDKDLDSMIDSTTYGEENGIKVTQNQHPVGGLLYYYSLIAGNETVFPKIYLPVTHYCASDLSITEAIERFYDDEEVKISGPDGGERGQGWVSREVAKAFDHRKLSEKTGIHTYVTFGLKANGWDLTSYFSPEPWAS